jgi:phosphatidylserine decarboxylase
MKIHKEGYRILLFSFLILLALNVAAVFLSGNITQYFVFFVSLVLYLFIILFFRLPDRSMTPISGKVISPADGKLVVIEEVFEKEYFNDTRIQVSIFMSPLNIHVNTYPVSGVVKYVKYHPGKYLVAWHPKSSELNERCSVVVQDHNGTEIMIRQIAGAMARRIVTYSKPGDNVVQGDELGFIKFGSRVDIFLPPGTQILAPFMQQVRANRTVITTI